MLSLCQEKQIRKVNFPVLKIGAVSNYNSLYLGVLEVCVCYDLDPADREAGRICLCDEGSDLHATPALRATPLH